MDGERQLVAWLRRLATGAGGERLGDDAAFLPAMSAWAATVDSQISGVHYPPGLDEAVIARRLLAVNLSDLAACGALPRFALLALSVSPAFDRRRFFRALVEACRRVPIELVGGDLARSPTDTSTLTLIGARRPGGRFLSRAAAHPGDALWSAGTLGLSAAGQRLLARGATWHRGLVTLPETFPATRSLRAVARRAVRLHLAPQPQLETSAWLAQQKRVAAIDVSDGFGLDLARLCEASGVGARVDTTALPVDRQLKLLASWLGGSALDLALGGGEDYALLFTLPPRATPPAELGCRRIGMITASRSRLRVLNGNEAPLSADGWDHLSGG